MQHSRSEGRLASRLVDSLYAEAMVLADEAHAYFDGYGGAERDMLAPLVRVSFSCESLKITTRLMHIVAWLLTRRAIESGEWPEDGVRPAGARLAPAEDSAPETVAALPQTACALITASRELYQRVQRFDLESERPETRPSPARGLLSRLEQAF
jgi:regulator of CtrA degradation